MGTAGKLVLHACAGPHVVIVRTCCMVALQGFRDSGIGSQGIQNSLAMMVKVKSTVINLDQPSYNMG